MVTMSTRIIIQRGGCLLSKANIALTRGTDTKAHGYYMTAICKAQNNLTGTANDKQCAIHRRYEAQAKHYEYPQHQHSCTSAMTQPTSFSFRPKRELGPSCSSQHSGAKGTSPPATPPNMSKPASTATITGPARVPGSFPLLFCKQTLPLHIASKPQTYLK